MYFEVAFYILGLFAYVRGISTYFTVLVVDVKANITWSEIKRKWFIWDIFREWGSPVNSERRAGWELFSYRKRLSRQVVVKSWHFPLSNRLFFSSKWICFIFQDCLDISQMKMYGFGWGFFAFCTQHHEYLALNSIQIWICRCSWHDYKDYQPCDAPVISNFISGYGFLKLCVPNSLELIITVQTASKNFSHF